MKIKHVICRDVKGRKSRVAVSDLDIRVSVYGLVFKGNKILLCPQWDGYDFPGGGIKPGETIAQALKREIWEETGLKARQGQLLTVETDFFIMSRNKKPVHSFLIYYLCGGAKGKISTKNLDEYEKKYASKALWVEAKKAARLKFYNGVDSQKLISKAWKVKTGKALKNRSSLRRKAY